MKQLSKLKPQVQAKLSAWLDPTRGHLENSLHGWTI